MNILVKVGEDLVHSVAAKDFLKVVLAAGKQLSDEGLAVGAEAAPSAAPVIRIFQPAVDSFFDSWLERVDHLLKNQEAKEPAVAAVAETPVESPAS